MTTTRTFITVTWSSHRLRRHASPWRPGIRPCVSLTNDVRHKEVDRRASTCRQPAINRTHAARCRKDADATNRSTGAVKFAIVERMPTTVQWEAIKRSTVTRKTRSVHRIGSRGVKTSTGIHGCILLTGCRRPEVTRSVPGPRSAKLTAIPAVRVAPSTGRCVSSVLGRTTIRKSFKCWNVER